MSDREYLVCPACGGAEPATERTACPACGSDRTYLHASPALPDATSEAYVKLDADEAADGVDADEAVDGSGSPDRDG